MRNFNTGMWFRHCIYFSGRYGNSSKYDCVSNTVSCKGASVGGATVDSIGVRNKVSLTLRASGGIHVHSSGTSDAF